MQYDFIFAHEVGPLQTDENSSHVGGVARKTCNATQTSVNINFMFSPCIFRPVTFIFRLMHLIV